jgi:redox-regulated HSP33 family molecular chaperone
VSKEVEILEAKGVLVEALPDSGESVVDYMPGEIKEDFAGTFAGRDLGGAVLRRTSPLRFACRCSPERAAAVLAASGNRDDDVPATVDVTCHMCGRTYTVRTK